MVTAKNLRFTTAMKERESERKRLIEGGRREQLLELRQLFAVSAVWKCTWLNILFFFLLSEGGGDRLMMMAVFVLADKFEVGFSQRLLDFLQPLWVF